MKRILVLCLGLSLVAACDRKATSVPAAPASPPASAETGTPLSVIEGRMVMMGLHFAKSPDDDRYTSFVAEYMKKKGLPTPANLRYAVGKLQTNWKVMAMDLEKVRKSEDGAGFTFVLKEDNGQLSVIHEEI
jgi:hypothetical protein